MPFSYRDLGLGFFSGKRYLGLRDVCSGGRNGKLVISRVDAQQDLATIEESTGVKRRCYVDGATRDLGYDIDLRTRRDGTMSLHGQSDRLRLGDDRAHERSRHLELARRGSRPCCDHDRADRDRAQDDDERRDRLGSKLHAGRLAAPALWPESTGVPCA